MKLKKSIRLTVIIAAIIMSAFTVNSQTTITIPIIKGEDDAEEVMTSLEPDSPVGSVDLWSSDLELGFDHEPQYVGLLFRDIKIPAYATIYNTYVQFQVDEVNVGSTDADLSLSVYGAKETTVESLTEEDFTISSHSPTDAIVTWVPEASVTEEGRGVAEQTPDLSSIIGEIISINGWVSGNNILIVIAGDPGQVDDINRVMESYDGEPQGTPTLIVTYELSDFARNEFVCQGDIVPPLTAGGDDVKWYSEPDFTGLLYSGNIYQTGKSEPGIYTFYVTSTFNDTILEDTATLTINEGYLPITLETSNDTVYCPGEQIADITAPALSGGVVSWYDDPWLSNLLGTGEYYNPSGITSTTTYYVTETVGECESHPGEVVIEIRNTTPYEGEKICMVTIDPNTGKNMIIWEKTPDMGTASYHVYRETSVTDIYDPIGLLSFADPGFFIDQDSDPAKQSYKYRLATVDSCDNVSILSDFHATMHLTLNIGLNDGTNLLWSKYMGFDVQTYNIWRGSDVNNMSLIGSVSGSNFTYTDLYPLAGTNIYQVEAVSPWSCDIGDLKSTHNSSFSNISYRYAVGIDESGSGRFRIFPNPVSNISTVEFSNPEGTAYRLRMTDMTGKVLRTEENITGETFVINREGLPGGLYFIELTGPNSYRCKLLIE